MVPWIGNKYYILGVCQHFCVSYPDTNGIIARNVMLPYVACSALQYFSTLSHKRHDVREKKIIAHKICILIFSTTFD